MIEAKAHLSGREREQRKGSQQVYAKKLKRPLDMILAIVLSVLFSPVIVLLAIGIKLTSRGPIFYRQLRIGKGGKPFTMLKFRSMLVDSDHQPHRLHVQHLIQENVGPKENGTPTLKLNADPRITPLGKHIRSTGLDELPQLINVMRGEMSLVGPRPPMPYEYEIYEERHKERMKVMPGITGLWQVTARNQVSFEEMVDIDLNYIEALNLGLDLKIMMLTPLEMLQGKGGG